MIRPSPLLVLAALAGPCGAVAQPALAPPAPDALGQTAPLSLQTQLGAIPLVGPRALQQAARTRAVRLTQLSEARAVIGAVREIACPETGCQHATTFEVGGQAMPFMVDMQFVGGGAYVSLQTRAVAVGAVVEFEKGRRGPVFIKGGSDAAMVQPLRFALAPAATLRRLDVAGDGNTLSAGNIYTRKRAPDLIVKVEIGPAQERR